MSQVIPIGGSVNFSGGGGSIEIPGGVVKKRQSPDFRSPEVGISDSCSHFSPCFDHTSPTQTNNDGTSQIHHNIRAYVPYSFPTVSQVLLRPLATELQG